MVQTRTCQANDGTLISYKYSSSHRNFIKSCILLIHGFSGSSDYFTRNIDALSKDSSVVAYDLRGHGESGRSSHGYHVNRLAADLKDLIMHLRKEGIVEDYTKLTGVGCSIGSAILWSYCELFTCSDFHNFVFVDQAPLQNYTANGDWGPQQGNYGCHDAASAAWNQATMLLDFESANKGLVESCLGYRFAPQDTDKISSVQKEADEAFFTTISAKCDPRWIGKLMGDHTAYDHRDTIRNCITIPALVIAGKRSGCFPTEGCFETARLINERHSGLARTFEFATGHWLFYEEAEKFNDMIKRFVMM